MYVCMYMYLGQLQLSVVSQRVQSFIFFFLLQSQFIDSS